MSSTTHASLAEASTLFAELAGRVDERTLEILERRRRTATVRRRGWLVRRMLLVADAVGLTLAFLLTETLVPLAAGAEVRLSPLDALFVLALPAWVVAAKLSGLYDRDEERTDHTTVDDIVRVFQLMTLGVWLFVVYSWATGSLDGGWRALVPFWALATVLVPAGRVTARTLCRRSITYLQNTIIVGAGDVGQLVGRKLLQHPEYGVNLVGFVDADPKERRPDLAHLTLLGDPDRLPAIVRLFDIERVVVAFSHDAHEDTIRLVRSLSDCDVQIDIVPRLYELVGPNVAVHTVEGLPLLGLPPARLSRSSRLMKRGLDVLGAGFGLLLAAPLLLYIAIRIKLDSPGPVFFRQTRLGMNMRKFTLLKFRTMRTGTDEGIHREYIKTLMDVTAQPSDNGLYKLDRGDVTRFGRWLRMTSIDELPQLINVLRGEMSLVGPRPCIPYEVEHFASHHFDRFLVPAGLTGLWQVTARAHTTFSEALEMDASYARGWSPGLDVALMLRTVRHVLRSRSTA